MLVAQDGKPVVLKPRQRLTDNQRAKLREVFVVPELKRAPGKMFALGNRAKLITKD